MHLVKGFHLYEVKFLAVELVRLEACSHICSRHAERCAESIIVGVLAYCSVCIKDLTDVAVVVTVSVLIVCVHRRHCLDKNRFWCKCSNNYSDCQIISILQVKIFLSIDILLSNNRTTKSHLCFLGNGNTKLLRDACA